MTDAYRLWHTVGVKSATGIVRQLRKDYGLDAKNERTVRRWLDYWRQTESDFLRLDEAFAWNQLDSYGLPWEASRFLLDFATMLIEHRNPTVVITDARGRRQSFPPTWREMRWAWRVHQALGGEAVMVYGDHVRPEYRLGHYLGDVEGVSAAFATRELVHHVLGEKLDLADLEGFLAYRPWEGHEERWRYLRAVEEGFIPGVRKIDLPEGLRALRQTYEDVERNVEADVWPDPDKPDLLPSGLAYERWKKETGSDRPSDAPE